MELPEATWLKQFSWCIIGISAIETAFTAPGSLFERFALSVLSCATVMMGFLTSCFFLYSYVAWLKRTPTGIEWQQRQNLKDIAILFFYFGGIGSGIAVFSYPILGGQTISFSIAPVGIGLMLGAKWTCCKYFTLCKSTRNNVIPLDEQNQ